jgi:pimeloyl-ACP methyl ester carboxylesterase
MTNTMFQKYAQQARQARAPLVFRAPDRFGSVNCLSPNGFHQVAYADWGPMQAEEVVACVHGLTRQGRDFDPLAARLAWDELKPPVLAVHGDQSDFVAPDLLAKMKRSMPTLSTFKVAETGHMPMLMSCSETGTVLSFLKSCA